MIVDLVFGTVDLFVSRLAVCGWLVVVLISSSLASQTFAQAADPADIFYKGQELHERGDLKGAIDLYNSALKAQPQFPEALYQRAVAERSLGLLPDAEASFRSAMAQKPDWVLPVSGLGATLIAESKWQEAGPVLQKALSMDASDAEALSASADLLIQTRAPSARMEQLLDQLGAAAAKPGVSAAVLSSKAALENALGRSAAARKTLDAAIADHPRDRPLLMQSAELYLALGNTAAARKNVDAILSASPRSANSVTYLNARLLAAEGRKEEAIVELNKISDPSTAVQTLKQQLAADSVTDPGDLEKRLTGGPADLAIRRRLCEVYRRSDPPKAIENCQIALKSDPFDAKTATSLGGALVQARRFTDAVGLLRQVIAREPANSPAHANLATALFQLKMYPQAKDEFLWLVSSDAKMAAPHLFLGIIHDELKEYVEASQSYDTYLRLADPVANKLDIEKVKLRMPQLQKLVKQKKS